MERRDHQTPCFFAPQRLGHTFFHFTRGFIGKGYRSNMFWLIATLADQMRNLISDDSGFARSRTGQHQAGSGDKFDGLLLAGI
ncbi:Uncharacterised protein [Yersinia enterocolitica]|nr:Uncharacterised protein [Yersinia enterocolitica]